MQFDRLIDISVAGSRKATVWQPNRLLWSNFVEKLRTAVRGTETLEEYLRLPKSKQDDLKDVGGFVGGTLAGNRRKAQNVTGRDLVTLDLDNIHAGGTEDVLKRLNGLGCSFVTYSTRKHEPGRPRLRAIMPLSRTVTADEYEPIARKMASLVGMTFADPTTFEASRLMYWPSVSSDSMYVYEYADKPFLDADGVLGMYNDWTDVEEWPRHQTENNKHVRMAAKQGDPTQKKGVVGAFCRTYNVHDVIEKFLPGVYQALDDGSGRYTFIEGSTVGGAVIYDNGNFLFSHHATDPCSGKLVNAFDLVRLHKFSDLDDDAKDGTPINRLPSFVAMSKFALEEAGIAKIINEERYERVVEQLHEDFGTPVPSPSNMPISTDGSNNSVTDSNNTNMQTNTEENKDLNSWVSTLKVSATTAQPLRTIENILIMLEGDPGLKNRIKLDEFSNALMGEAPLPWSPRNEEKGLFEWTENDDSGLSVYMEKVLLFQSKEKMKHALNQIGAKNRFNPVKTYLENLKWDGVKRLDNLFIDYLGADGSNTITGEYVRAVTRKSFVAAVERIFRPGAKHDTMVVLTGAQGIGKSTLLAKMGKSWFTDAVESFDGKQAAELLQGSWIVEIGEMSAYNKSDLNTIKGFLSRTTDHFRAAYAARTEKHPRKCVFFGTSNRYDYLRDATGSRRFYPVDVGVQAPTKQVFGDLDREVDQVWAEAVMYWRLGEKTFLTGSVLEEAKRQQEGHTEQHPWESLIADFVKKKVLQDWNSVSIEDRKSFWGGFDKSKAALVERDRVCAAEVYVECLHGELKYMKRSDTMTINDILSNLEGWEKKKSTQRFGPYGHVKGGYFRSF